MTLVRFGHRNPGISDEEIIAAFQKYAPKDAKINKMATKRTEKQTA